MRYIIDTNLLYYWAGVEHPGGYSESMVYRELSSLDVFVSELSLLEMMTHYKDQSKIELIVEFIRQKKLGIHRIFFTISPVIPAEFCEILRNENLLAKYQGFLREEKIKIELELLNFCIESLVAAFVLVVDKRQALPVENRQLFGLQCESMLLGNRARTKEQLIRLLREFYVDENEQKFKPELETIVWNYFNVVSINHATARNGHMIADSIDQVEEVQISDSLAKDQLSKRILQQIKYDRQGLAILPSSYKQDLNCALNDYENEMLKRANNLPTINPGVVKYFAVLIGKLLLNISGSDQRLGKNDIIDSQFLNYYPGTQLLTFDKKLKNIIKDIDETYYLRNEAFRTRCQN